MTTYNIAVLCERLRAVRSQGIRAGKFWNEDGPQAADTLERQATEIERMRVALERLANKDNEFDSEAQIIARAALTGEDA